MAKHWSGYKKYQTSASYCGFHFCVKDELGAAVCGGCGKIVEFTNEARNEETEKEFETAMEEIKAHFTEGCNA